MKICALSAYEEPYPLTVFRQCVEMDRFGVHSLTDDPEEADFILFLEHGHYEDDPFYQTLWRHPWVRRYSEKCLMYNEHDRAWFVLPGLYCSMPRRYAVPARQRAYAYLREGNPMVEEAAAAVIKPKLLFSFMGSINCGVRGRILRVQDTEGHVEDTSSFRAANDAASPESPWRRYAQVMADSRFVLCPRGHGASSYRLFETMRAGRAPVILSVRVDGAAGAGLEPIFADDTGSEHSVAAGTLRGASCRWEEMGALARKAWEEWFAPNVKFHRMAENGASLMAHGPLFNSPKEGMCTAPFAHWAARVMARRIAAGLRARRRP